jgi:alpha-1,3-rhamnosyl/mannosyltransferase
MLDVVLDMTPVAHSRGGVGKYLVLLASSLHRIARDEGLRFRTLDIPAARPGTQPLPAEPDLTLANPLYLGIPLLRRLPIKHERELRSRGRRLAALLGKKGIFHHSGVQPVCPLGWTSVLTMFDLSAIRHKEWHTPETVTYGAREKQLTEEGSRLLAISRWAADEAESFFSLESGTVGIAGGAADPIFQPGEPDPRFLAENGLERERFVLHVGSFVPRKNIPFLLDVYSACVDDGFDYPLVMVGAEEWGELDIDTDLPWLRTFSGISDDLLLSLYRGARAVLLPSRYEGLGFPALEAMACGRPLLCSNAAALPETVGNGGLLLDPDDACAWRRAISLLDDAEHLSILRKMSTGVHRRTWEEVASNAAAFYRSISE